ncbi:MAG: NAD(P)H-dependent oxidoreductase, partial [bacterium]|nr:NAD(P)H-dependent oxidoreductase [bacterium]
MKLLAIDSSILNSASVSHHLTKNFINQWQASYPNSEIVYRDLHEQPINHLSQKILVAATQNQSELSNEIQLELHISHQVMAEFLSADILVLGVPMYNFAIPSQLKAWIDRIVVAGKTFKYVDGKVKGLSDEKQVYILSSRGGYYQEEPMNAFDYQE